MAAGAVRLELAFTPVTQQRFGKNTARRIAGAYEKHIAHSCNSADKFADLPT
jgi:hypothetical protein